jgi:hypothetical protein
VTPQEIGEEERNGASKQQREAEKEKDSRAWQDSRCARVEFANSHISA